MCYTFHKSFLPTRKKKKKEMSNREQVDVNYRALCYLENLGDLMLRFVRHYTGQKPSTEIQCLNSLLLFSLYVICGFECKTQLSP